MRTPPKRGLNPNEVYAEAEIALRERRVAEAIDLYSIAEANGFDADACCGARWVCRMLQGDFRSAWSESERIEKHGRPDRNRFWDGQSLRGKRVLIRCLHGLGDTIQYIRYAPLVRAKAAHLIVETQPSLKRLMEQAGLADEVITWGEAEPVWDRQIEIIELPRIFKTTLRTIPKAIPYLKAKPRGELGPATGRFRAGLVWASSKYNPARSVPLGDLAPLFETANVAFYSFQAGEEREELKRVEFPIRDAFETSGCVQETANGLASMDLLITVDTMAAHLAGALGLPVWTLLPFQADWRWMLQRSDSPWYPTMKLFRQRTEGEWSDPIARVRTELQSFASEAGAACSATRDPGFGPGRVQKNFEPTPS